MYIKYNVFNEKFKNAIRKYIEYTWDNCDLNWIDTSRITDMPCIFIDTNFNGDISNWDVSHVRNMSSMFESNKFDGDISKCDVSNVEDMSICLHLVFLIMI